MADEAELVQKVLDRFQAQVVGVDLSHPLRKDFVAFYHAVTGFDMPGWQQKVLPDLLDPSVKRLLILAPPGHAKSTLLGVFAAWRLGHNPNERILLASHKDMYAQAKADYIAGLLADPHFVAAFGQRIPDESSGLPWNTKRRFVTGRTVTSMDNPSLSAVGAEAGTLSVRVTLIIGDDIESLRNSATPAMREKIKSWFFGPLMTRVDWDIGGRIVVVGSWLYEKDLYDVLRHDKTWTVHEFPSTVEHPLWPEKIDRESLESLRTRVASVYYSMYGGRPMASGASVFKDEYWKVYAVLPEDNLLTYMAVDPTSTATAQSDYFALVVASVYSGYIYTRYLAYRRDLSSLSQRLDLVQSVYNAFKPHRLLIENNGGQQHFVDAVRELIPSAEGISHNVPKDMRLRMLADRLKAGIVYLPGVIKPDGTQQVDATYRPLLNEAATYPAGHDDALDALQTVVEALLHGPTPAASARVPKEYTQQRMDKERRAGKKGRKRRTRFRPSPGILRPFIASQDIDDIDNT